MANQINATANKVPDKKRRIKGSVKNLNKGLSTWYLLAA
jgi:hypothetical protein